MADESQETVDLTDTTVIEKAEASPPDDPPPEEPPTDEPKPDASPPDEPKPDIPPPEPSSALVEVPTFDLEILSEQFENYLRIVQAYLQTLKRPKDIEVGANLLRKVQRLNDSKELEVRKNNNNFFRYWVKILKWTSENQPLDLYKFWYRNKETVDAVTESRTWLEDNKSYMALKYLKDGTYIIYAAVADDPSSGWQDGGLNILAKRGSC